MDYSKKNTALLAFEFFHKVVLFSILYPFLVYGLRFLMESTGINYLTNQYVYSFFLSPETIIFIIMLLTIIGSAIMYELTCVDMMINLSDVEQKIDLYAICIKGIRRMRRVLNLKNIWIVIYVLLHYVCMNIFIVYYSFHNNDFVQMIIKGIKDTKNLTAVVVIALILIYLLVFGGSFTLNYFMNNGGTFIECYKKSVRLVRDNLLKSLIFVVLFNLGTMISYALLYILVSLVVIGGVHLFDVLHLGPAIYLTIIRLFQQISVIVIQVFSIPLSYVLITRMYQDEMREASKESVGYNFETGTITPGQNRLVTCLIILAVVASAIVVIQTRTMNIFGDVEFLRTTQITAHRGSGQECPENTMPAFERALEELADCIEIDVRQTLDGEFVIMHDQSLRRTTGLRQNVESLTFEQIKTLDAGSWKSEEYAGVQVPSLEEVLEFAKGRVRLNIELKTSDTDRDFAKMLVELIEEYDMVDNCVVSSFDIDLLREIKVLNEDFVTGYILSAAYGDYFSMEQVDFFSVNYAFVSKSMVERAHAAGKEVHVWTVNSRKIMERMIECGVDTIITDNPLLAREIIYAKHTSDTMIEMLEYVFER